MMQVIQRVDAACLSKRDRGLCHLWLDELDVFYEKLIDCLGAPDYGKKQLVFCCGNVVYVRATKEYYEKCLAFYLGWIAAKPSSVCNHWLVEEVPE